MSELRSHVSRLGGPAATPCAAPAPPRSHGTLGRSFPNSSSGPRRRHSQRARPRDVQRHAERVSGRPDRDICDKLRSALRDRRRLRSRARRSCKMLSLGLSQCRHHKRCSREVRGRLRARCDVPCEQHVSRVGSRSRLSNRSRCLYERPMRTPLASNRRRKRRVADVRKMRALP